MEHLSTSLQQRAWNLGACYGAHLQQASNSSTGLTALNVGTQVTYFLLLEKGGLVLASRWHRHRMRDGMENGTGADGWQSGSIHSIWLERLVAVLGRNVARLHSLGGGG